LPLYFSEGEAGTQAPASAFIEGSLLAAPCGTIP
jgi:hypothetical protein